MSGAPLSRKADRPIPGLSIVKGDTVESTAAFEGLARRIHAYNDRLMLTEHVMEAGSVFPRHSHPHHQLAYVVSGHLRIVCGDHTFEARGGDSFVLDGGIEHQVTALERSVALDIFTPFREDYVSVPPGVGQR
jgi:quercetin dioxygenase-like cupin family protein